MGTVTTRHACPAQSPDWTAILTSAISQTPVITATDINPRIGDNGIDL
jgi:hypothetical protein